MEKNLTFELDKREKVENPPAFPYDYCENGGSMGMTLLDYFAAKAMQGHIDNQFEKYDEVARWAYNQAEAMLKERQNHL